MQTGNQSQFCIRSVQGPPFSALGGLITTEALRLIIGK
jgi:hypothetical protein